MKTDGHGRQYLPRILKKWKELKGEKWENKKSWLNIYLVIELDFLFTGLFSDQ